MRWYDWGVPVLEHEIFKFEPVRQQRCSGKIQVRKSVAVNGFFYRVVMSHNKDGISIRTSRVTYHKYTSLILD